MSRNQMIGESARVPRKVPAVFFCSLSFFPKGRKYLPTRRNRGKRRGIKIRRVTRREIQEIGFIEDKFSLRFGHEFQRYGFYDRVGDDCHVSPALFPGAVPTFRPVVDIPWRPESPTDLGFVIRDTRLREDTNETLAERYSAPLFTRNRSCDTTEGNLLLRGNLSQNPKIFFGEGEGI
ncbi:uncharacterized protein LOC105694163 [Orussus abietinus]|uniref:uncharacterized protein LOC105694163 n=1 Tax=Orussus abietinus TaxID=222816 RepID=UPI0006252964|nr:uncharacterized protein LOC105694163 [Orussus abietinus]XP_012269991.1 uncharacterized protein LOC105694163 [Orussus abietinus]